MRGVFVLAFPHDTGPKFGTHGTLGTLVRIDKQVSERDDRREATELTQELTQDYINNPQVFCKSDLATAMPLRKPLHTSFS